MKGVVGAVGKVIDRLTLPARERNGQLEAEFGDWLNTQQEMARSRSAAVVRCPGKLVAAIMEAD